MSWILLVLLYGLLKGGREIAKKKAMNRNSVMEVLIAYTFISFLMVVPQAKDAGGLEPKFYFYIALKSFAIFIAWICSFRSLKNLPVSLYGILDLSRVLFATLSGVFLLGEVLSVFQIAGLFIVCTGLLLLKFKPPFLKRLFKIEEKPAVKIYSQPSNITAFYIVLALISCVLNAFSGFMDKVLMKDISSSQLQFWYMLFLVLYYLVYVLIAKEKISRSIVKNGWVWLLAVMFVIGDKALFIANGMPESKITVMTLIKQSGCLVTIIGGRFVFKEKNTGYRMFCALIVLIGIGFGVIR